MPKTDERAGQATDRAELERQIMDPNVPKNEREWWAAREIERLRTPASGEAGEMVERLLQIRGTQFTPTENALVTEAADLIERLAATDTEAMRLLREARKYISDGDLGHSDTAEILARIDALAKGGA